MANSSLGLTIATILLLNAYDCSAQNRTLHLGTIKLQNHQIDSMVLSSVVQALGINSRGSINGYFSFPLNQASLSIIELEVNNLDSGQYSGIVTIDTIQFEIEDGFVYRGILLKYPEDTLLLKIYSKDTLLVDSLLWNFHRSNETGESLWLIDSRSKIREGSGIIIDEIIEPDKVFPYTHLKFYSMGILQPGEVITISTTELLKEGIILSPKASQINIFKESGKIISFYYSSHGDDFFRSYDFDENQQLVKVYDYSKGRDEKMIKIRYRNSVKDLSIKQIVDSFPP